MASSRKRARGCTRDHDGRLSTQNAMKCSCFYATQIYFQIQLLSQICYQYKSVLSMCRVIFVATVLPTHHDRPGISIQSVTNAHQAPRSHLPSRYNHSRTITVPNIHRPLIDPDRPLPLRSPTALRPQAMPHSAVNEHRSQW